MVGCEGNLVNCLPIQSAQGSHSCFGLFIFIFFWFVENERINPHQGRALSDLNSEGCNLVVAQSYVVASLFVHANL